MVENPFTMPPEDVEAYNNKSGKPNGQAGSEPKFPFTPFEEIKFSPTSAYLVKGLIPREGLIIVWGKPKCGKSFWTFDLSMHVALGWKYRELRVNQCGVAYLALEGGRGFKGRVEAWRKKHDYFGKAPFYLCDRPMPAGLAADHTELIKSVNETIDAKGVGLIILDTLNRSLAGSESSDQDMSAYIKAADVLRETFKCAVLVVHHCGLAEERPRGHTSLLGAGDCQISVKRDSSNNIIAEVEWMKDGLEGAKIVSRLEVVPLGVDDDGENVDSCVIISSNVEDEGRKERMEANTRIRILEEIQAKPNRPQCEIVEILGVNKSTVSRAIDKLEQEKLIKKNLVTNKYTILKKGKDALTEINDPDNPF